MAKTIPQLQVVSASKEKGSSWGVDIAYNGKEHTIFPLPSENCNIKKLNGTYDIIWMLTNEEMCNNRQYCSYVKFKQMLYLNDNVQLVLFASTPQNVHLGRTEWTMNRSTVKDNWNVNCEWKKRKMNLTLGYENKLQYWQQHLHWPLIVVSMMGSDGKWLFTSNGTAD